MISMRNDAHKLTLKEIAKRINSDMDSLVESKRTRFSEETVLFQCVMSPAPSVGFSVTCDYVIDLCDAALQRNNCPEELKPQLEKCKAYAVRMQNEGLYSKDEYKLFHKILKEKSLVVVPADKIQPGNRYCENSAMRK